jgi:hypothetical protein
MAAQTTAATSTGLFERFEAHLQRITIQGIITSMSTLRSDDKPYCGDRRDERAIRSDSRH